MKRGIPIAWQAAGVLLVCLATTLNHPVIAIERRVSIRDTVHYYNKQGKEIFCDTKVDSAGNYVIRTCKTHRQIFDDWYDRVETKNSGGYEPAQVCGIKGREARKAGRLIRRGHVDNPLVLKCIVPILDKWSIKKMLDSIKEGRAKDVSDGKLREYGGKINGDTTFECQRGNATNPRNPENEGLNMEVGERGNFHSHPEGYIETKDSISRDAYNPNRVIFSERRITRKDKFVQGPSRRDQQFSKDKTGYVFGMREDTHLIYVFDGRGVLAILPFKFLPSK